MQGWLIKRLVQVPLTLLVLLTVAFLMTGVSTDYTEILSLKETTKSWKIAFFLPLVTSPQIIIIAISRLAATG